VDHDPPTPSRIATGPPNGSPSALGVLLIILGLVLPALIPTFAYAHLLVVVGAILLVVGLLLVLAGRMGSPVGGRRHYY